jgi:transcriptional regulator with XRE-family HTH domain
MADDETYFENGREYYKATGNPVWPSRHRERPSLRKGDEQHKGPLIETSYVRLLLERLDGLEQKTRPSSGDLNAERKDLAAFDALKFAGNLVRYVAGWAIDHQIGLAAEGLKFVPLQPFGTKNHPQYLAERSLVDSHAHEKTGGVRSHDDDDGGAFVARKSLVNLLRANPGAMPSWLRHKTIEGLEALDYGEVQPMFAPISTGRKRDLTLLRYQLQALALVAYRRKLGLKKEKSLEQVADALGISPHTLLSWETRLRNEFGRLQVDRTISFAENHASWVAAARKKARRGEEAEDTEVHEAGYDDVALMKLGKKYKAAL